MVPRMLNKDMRLAFLKLEKLPLDQIRKVGRSSKDSNADVDNCKKCERLMAKAFDIDDHSTAILHSTTDKQDEEKLTQKLETIDELPLLETEAKVDGFNVSPQKLRSQYYITPSIESKLPKSNEFNRTALDDIAIKLMKLPSKEIDAQLRKVYGICDIKKSDGFNESILTHQERRQIENASKLEAKSEMSVVSLVPIVEANSSISNHINLMANQRSSDEHDEVKNNRTYNITHSFKHHPNRTSQGDMLEIDHETVSNKPYRDVHDVFTADYNISEFEEKQFYSYPLQTEYQLDIEETFTQQTCKADKAQPMHIDVEFLNFIEKSSSREQILRKVEESQSGQLFTSCEISLLPITSTNTSISSQINLVPTGISADKVQGGCEKRSNLDTFISKNSHPNTTEQDDSIRETDHRNYFQGTQTFEDGDVSATFDHTCSTPNSSDTVRTNLSMAAVPPKLEEALDDKNLPLSELLNRIRIRSKIEQYKEYEQILLSKNKCLPPLDRRQRSQTCSPPPCRAAKKSPCAPKNPCPPPPPPPCPPPKKPCPPKDPCKKPSPCPPPKSPCPPPKSPCPPPKSPCPPPKSPCPPPKSPCPPPKSPCPPCPPPKKDPCKCYIGNKFIDTITLILFVAAPTNTARNALLPLLLSYFTKHFLRNSLTTRTFHTTSPSEDVVPRLENLNKKLRNYHFRYETLDAKLEAEKVLGEKGEQIVSARSFDPWTPIPSWPMQEKEVKKRFICPKEGCKLPQPRPDSPCKEKPCANIRNQKFSEADSGYIQ